MYLLGFIIFTPLIIISIAEDLKCSDITTRRAIEKRGQQINLKCLENKKQLEECNNHTAVDNAWNDFEQINEIYFTKINSSCKVEKRKKRHCKCDSHSLHQHHDNLNLHYPTRKLNGNRMRRNVVHGTSDDKNDLKVENDYSKNFKRFKRNECLKSSEREKNRLLEKFATSCKPDAMSGHDMMSETCKDNMGELSRRRYKAYNNYVRLFQNCYGHIN
ncbi:unnamed protein product [Cercopithifilaria johnstoni]|uniref:Uncharacterized protein n=1 Tax=Cercopithifilaria johnstoni TaxID=2874296 RepID=A0A8J2PWU8_9BILA|nr:unnamed protein product [Cercopithifilaria johnstoni]